MRVTIHVHHWTPPGTWLGTRRQELIRRLTSATLLRPQGRVNIDISAVEERSAHSTIPGGQEDKGTVKRCRSNCTYRRLEAQPRTTRPSINRARHTLLLRLNVRFTPSLHQHFNPAPNNSHLKTGIKRQHRASSKDF